MVKLYFNNRETKEERSRFRFDSQEDKECRAGELSMLGQKHDMGGSCEDSSEEEKKKKESGCSHVMIGNREP